MNYFTMLCVLLSTVFCTPVIAHATEFEQTSVKISQNTEGIGLEDGTYQINVALEGGSGRATIESPTELTVTDHQAVATITWSSSNYDYMIVDGETYTPVNTEGNSVFEIPVAVLDEAFEVIADTTAMSVPHEITYTLCFDSGSVQKVKENQNRWETVSTIIVLIAIALAYLFAQKRRQKAKQSHTGERIGMLFLAVLLATMPALTACGTSETEQTNANATVSATAESSVSLDGIDANRNTDISANLTFVESMELEYAEEFAVDYYEDGYVLLTIADGSRYLVVPEDQEAPTDLEDDIVVLQRPLNNIYLVASAVMDMFRELDAIDTIRFSGQKEDGWYIEEAKEAMERGDMIYAGKYNTPDYELILSEGSSLAIENTMIYHTPEVGEKLESFGIPMMVDYSSYESHPLGRVEWVKFYGALLGKEEAAMEAFSTQTAALERALAKDSSNKTVAFFYITTNGTVNVRKTSDYVPKMIELAGGTYIFDQLGDEESRSSTMGMQMEEFYATAKDADYLIYNSTIDGELDSVDELLDKSSLLADFKAVKEGNVWCVTSDLYQQSMSIGTMIEDIQKMLSDDAQAQQDMSYLYHLD
jgi:iron complex transport system substrate-binding protein